MTAFTRWLQSQSFNVWIYKIVLISTLRSALVAIWFVSVLSKESSNAGGSFTYWHPFYMWRLSIISDFLNRAYVERECFCHPQERHLGYTRWSNCWYQRTYEAYTGCLQILVLPRSEPMWMWRPVMSDTKRPTINNDSTFGANAILKIHTLDKWCCYQHLGQGEDPA